MSAGRSRRVAVVGFGVTGKAVAAARAAAGDQVIVFEDSISADAKAAAEHIGVDLEQTPGPGALGARLAGIDLVVPSPGIPIAHPVYALAADAGVPVLAEIELGYRLCAERGRPRLLAVTGTNGKTTVTTLATAILKESGIEAVAGGNIGVPLIEAATSDADVCVAEVSSFQLQFTETFRPEVSCWLNLSPDHLDWHPDLDHYARAKARIWANQGRGDTAVVNADDPAVRSAVGTIPRGVSVQSFSTLSSSEADCYRIGPSGMLLTPDGTEIIESSALPRALPHDLSNSLAAAALALAAGAGLDACRRALGHAPLLPHRVSLVGSYEGVDWYDDSKATTPASVLAAVAGFQSVVLIAGGRNKGLDLGVLAQTAPPVRAVVAIGEAAADVVAAFGGKAPAVVAASMQEAVAAAADVARAGDAVLLSPGCASFDWYSSYAARGDDFASAVRRRSSRSRRRSQTGRNHAD